MVRPGARFDRAAPALEGYRLHRLLGRGGMGEVWLASDLTLQREVAVKVIRKEYAEDPEFGGRFFEEMKTVARFRHPNICTVYGTGRTADGRLAMIMELLEGRSLKQVVDAQPRAEPLDEVRAAFFIAQALEAVQEAHEKGILHRDIKPDNMMVRDDGHVHLLDFGVAARVQRTGELGRKRHAPQVSTLLGTPRYMAPELILHGRNDTRGDLYSMGVTAYYTIGGDFPYPNIPDDNETGILAAHVHLDPVPIAELRPGCSEALAGIITKLLAKNPDDRYQTAEDVIRQLSALVRSSLPPDDPIARRIIQNRERKARKAAYEIHVAREEVSRADRSIAEASPPQSEKTPSGDRQALPPQATKPLPRGFVPPNPASGAPETATPSVQERSTIPLPFGFQAASPCATSTGVAVPAAPHPISTLRPRAAGSSPSVPSSTSPGWEQAPGKRAAASFAGREPPARDIRGRQLAVAVGTGIVLAAGAAAVMLGLQRAPAGPTEPVMDGGTSVTAARDAEPAPDPASTQSAEPNPPTVERAATSADVPTLAPTSTAVAATRVPPRAPAAPTTRPSTAVARPVALAEGAPSGSDKRPITPPPGPAETAVRPGRRPITPPPHPAETAARPGKRPITPPPWPTE